MLPFWEVNIPPTSVHHVFLYPSKVYSNNTLVQSSRLATVIFSHSTIKNKWLSYSFHMTQWRVKIHVRVPQPSRTIPLITSMFYVPHEGPSVPVLPSSILPARWRKQKQDFYSPRYPHRSFVVDGRPLLWMGFDGQVFCSPDGLFDICYRCFNTFSALANSSTWSCEITY